MKLKGIIGYVGLRICDILPQNESKIKLGQTQLRRFFAKLFMASCGKKTNIQKNTRFSHTCKIGDFSTLKNIKYLY